MLAFACPRCGILVQVPEHAAGKKVRCGGCHQVVDAPQTATALTGAFAAPHQVPGGPRPVEDRPTLPPHGADAGPASAADRELYDFLAPPHGPGELGRLGPYRVLGSGGMGVVFEAEDTQLHRPVALKALLPALAASAAARERFLREARAAAAVAHDHVVTIYQVGEDRGIPFLAMQLLRGETLEARLRREKRLPAAEVIRLGREIAEGLAAAHARGLIHRDVKPSNVWLEAGTGRVKLLDFGLALAAGADTRLTQTGALVGTLGYLAPEQTRPGPPDPRADLFALGCVLYRLTTGVLPFRGTDALSTLSALATEVPRPVRELNPQVPPPLSDLITRLLSKDPAGRPPSAQAVVLALSALGARPAPAARPVPGPDP